MIGTALPPARVREAVGYAWLGRDRRGPRRGLVRDAERIAELNETWRENPGRPTCSRFRSTRTKEAFGQREFGDVFICPEFTEDLTEAVVHGVLHLTGMDHEADDGEMLVVQAEIMGWLR